MIIEIGAGLAVAGSIALTVTARVHARRAIAAARASTKKAQDLAERFQARLEAQNEIIGRLRRSVELLRGERDAAQRALAAAMPIRGARGRFAKRYTGTGIAGKQKSAVIHDEFEGLSKV